MSNGGAPRSAEEIDDRSIRRKTIFCLVAMGFGVVIAAIDIWLIKQGIVLSPAAKRLAAFVVLGSVALAVVAVLALLALQLDVGERRRLAQRKR